MIFWGDYKLQSYKDKCCINRILEAFLLLGAIEANCEWIDSVFKSHVIIRIYDKLFIDISYHNINYLAIRLY